MIENEKSTLQETETVQEEHDWYIVRCQVGKEVAIKSQIEEKIKSTAGIEKKIFAVLVPEEEEIRITKGEKVVVRKPTYKGYIYVSMILDSETYWFIKNVPGVKGFLGGNQPEKMSKKEVEAIKSLVEKLKSSQPKVARKFDVGDTVRIIEGPFKHFHGVIEEINEERGKIKMMITVFGRPTPVELDFTQVEKI